MALSTYYTHVEPSFEDIGEKIKRDKYQPAHHIIVKSKENDLVLKFHQYGIYVASGILTYILYAEN